MTDLVSLQRSAARLALGRVTAADLKSAAHEAINAGAVTPSLSALATLASDALSDAEPMFRKALSEVGLDVPATDAAVWMLLRVSIEAIARDEVDPEIGLESVMDVYDAAGLHGRSAHYTGDSHDIEGLVGSYWSVRELQEHIAERDFDLLYGAALQEARAEIVERANKWLVMHAA